jgi:arylsulfatase A-like enzyme
MMSDNGPSRHPANWLDGNQEPYYGASAGELRGGKTSLFEGGIRSPSVLHWPNRVRAGQVVSSPVLGIDLLPSLVAAAGGSTEGLDLDGVDLIPTLTGKSSPPERDLFWSFRHQTAMRRGQWKVVLEPYESDDNPAAELEYLFNLEADPSESINLKSAHPELFAELKAVALSWRAGLEIAH